MVGITAYGAYVPFNRLQRKKIKDVLGIPVAGGEKAVANYDEDSVSMAVSAALNCIAGKDTGRIDALYFATTTSPYREKQSATTIAKAIDLRDDIRTADFADSLRVGSTALLTAVDAVRSWAGEVLVTMADCRLGASQSQFEQTLGDGGVAFVVGKENVLAEVEYCHSIAGEIIDYWRSSQDTFIRSWEERFIISQGYNRAVPLTVKQLLQKVNLSPADFARIVLYGPNPRYQMALAQKMGFQSEQIQDSLFATVGNAGTANAPMMLAGALDEASPGDRILFVTFGEGCDALIFRVTDNISSFRPLKSLNEYIQSKRSDMDYGKYLKWRNLLTLEPPRRPERNIPSVAAMWRKYKQNLSFYGSRCTACGTPQFPVQRVCIHCQAKDEMEDYRFADKKAVITTYTVDYLAASPDPPTTIAVIDFSGGGRMICEMTDADPSRVEIGMEVEMSFRRLYEAGGIHNYFWKAQPKR